MRLDLQNMKAMSYAVEMFSKFIPDTNEPKSIFITATAVVFDTLKRLIAEPERLKELGNTANEVAPRAIIEREYTLAEAPMKVKLEPTGEKIN
jgi:hypothetical protein